MHAVGAEDLAEAKRLGIPPTMDEAATALVTKAGVLKVVGAPIVYARFQTGREQRPLTAEEVAQCQKERRYAGVQQLFPLQPKPLSEWVADFKILLLTGLPDTFVDLMLRSYVNELAMELRDVPGGLDVGFRLELLDQRLSTLAEALAAVADPRAQQPPFKFYGEPIAVLPAGSPPPKQMASRRKSGSSTGAASLQTDINRLSPKRPASQSGGAAKPAAVSGAKGATAPAPRAGEMSGGLCLAPHLVAGCLDTCRLLCD